MSLTWDEDEGTVSAIFYLDNGALAGRAMRMVCAGGGGGSVQQLSLPLRLELDIMYSGQM